MKTEINNVPFKINLSGIKANVFYKHIYPVAPKDFFYNSYVEYKKIIDSYFILSTEQWNELREEWDIKEVLLTAK